MFADASLLVGTINPQQGVVSCYRQRTLYTDRHGADCGRDLTDDNAPLAPIRNVGYISCHSIAVHLYNSLRRKASINAFPTESSLSYRIAVGRSDKMRPSVILKINF